MKVGELDTQSLADTLKLCWEKNGEKRHYTIGIICTAEEWGAKDAMISMEPLLSFAGEESRAIIEVSIFGIQ